MLRFIVTGLLIFGFLVPSANAEEHKCTIQPTDPAFSKNQECLALKAQLQSLNMDQLHERFPVILQKIQEGDEAGMVEFNLIRQVMTEEMKPDTQGTRTTNASSHSTNDACINNHGKIKHNLECCFPNKRFSTAELEGGIRCKSTNRKNSKKSITRYYKMDKNNDLYQCLFRVDAEGGSIHIGEFPLDNRYTEQYNVLGYDDTASCHTSLEPVSQRQQLEWDVNDNSMECKTQALDNTLFESKTAQCKCEPKFMDIVSYTDSTDNHSAGEKKKYWYCSCESCEPKKSAN